jgi:chemotaxis protein histidine kinase CheA
MDGHVSVATKPERYTRFRIQLPALAETGSTATPQRVA